MSQGLYVINAGPRTNDLSVTAAGARPCAPYRSIDPKIARPMPQEGGGQVGPGAHLLTGRRVRTAGCSCIRVCDLQNLFNVNVLCLKLVCPLPDHTWYLFLLFSASTSRPFGVFLSFAFFLIWIPSSPFLYFILWCFSGLLSVCSKPRYPG
jgi:hypothetical protein